MEFELRISVGGFGVKIEVNYIKPIYNPYITPVKGNAQSPERPQAS